MMKPKRQSNILCEGQHGIFSTWYSNADPLERTFQIDYLLINYTLKTKNRWKNV